MGSMLLALDATVVSLVTPRVGWILRWGRPR